MLVEHKDRLLSSLYLKGCEATPKEQLFLPGIGTINTVHLYCDHIEKEEYVDVYASQHNVDVKDWWADHGTLLFRYDPENDQLPSITATGKAAILISIPTVSSVAIKVDKWNGIDVRYEIGHIHFQ